MTTIDRPIAGLALRSLGVTPLAAAAFLLAHVPLAIAMRTFPSISTLHGACVLALGIVWAVGGHEDRIAAWGGYVAVCDVLWRMTRASLPWEFAKYALVLVLGLAIVRSGRLRGMALPFVYLVLLLPSSFLVWNLGPRAAFNALSFNLSGPLALAVCAWFFSRLTLSGSTYVTVLVAMAAPTIGVGSIALSRVLSAAAVSFRDSSNFATSGGFGPNQVSAVLGLGAVVSLFLLLATRGAVWLKAIFFALMVGLACQSALTFSRGGLYTAGGAVLAALWLLLRERRTRRRVAVGGTVAFGLALFLVLPGLESFTGGALRTRFEDVGTTGREEIVRADLTIWKENPIFGVGPGMGEEIRGRLLGTPYASHTEWSRLLAEHGLFGLGAAVCVIVMVFRAGAHDKSRLEKALAVGFAVWSVLFMFHAGMRLAAPAFALGLAQCRWFHAPAHRPPRIRRREGEMMAFKKERRA